MKPKTVKQKKAQARNLSLGAIQRCRTTLDKVFISTTNETIKSTLNTIDSYLEYTYELINESIVDEWDESRQT